MNCPHTGQIEQWITPELYIQLPSGHFHLSSPLILTPKLNQFFFFSHQTYKLLGFPDSSIVKESACNAGDLSSIPGLGRSTEGIGYPHQYSRAFLVVQLLKESACNAGDLSSIPGLGTSAGEENGYPLQYSCLENSRDWQVTVHWVTKCQTRLND